MRRALRDRPSAWLSIGGWHALFVLLAGCAHQQSLPHNRTENHVRAENAPVRGRVRVHYDARLQSTIVRIIPPRCAGPRTDLFAGGSFAGRTPSGNDTVLIGIRRSAQRWRLDQCPRLVILVDEVQLFDTAAKRDVQIDRGQLTEYFYGLVPLRAVASLAASQAGFIGACGKRFALRSDEIANLRSMVRRMSPPALPAAVSAAPKVQQP